MVENKMIRVGTASFLELVKTLEKQRNALVRRQF